MPDVHLKESEDVALRMAVCVHVDESHVVHRIPNIIAV